MPNSQYERHLTDQKFKLVKSREVVWLVSGHGPFRTYFLNQENDRSCRLCSEEEETLDLNSISEFEKIAQEIVSKLYRSRD